MKAKELEMFPDGRMDVRTAASYLGFSEKTLAMMRCDGTGPKFIKRGRVFYYLEDLNEWLNENGKATSTAQSKAASSKKIDLPPKRRTKLKQIKNPQ